MKTQGQQNALELRLQKRLAELERENNQLWWENQTLRTSEARYRSCFEKPISIIFIAADGRPVEANRAFEQQYGMTIAQTSQERVAQLAKVNQELRQRDTILEATATAANALLTVENFDAAVNTALQIIGEALDTDRVTVIENFESPSESSSVLWRILYEWNSANAISQISHRELAQGSYEGIEEWYELHRRGQGISCLLEEMPEPFRSKQAELGVKALNAVPIFVEGKYWGVVGFDDCREAKCRSTAELAVLKTAAACIGSAIQCDRIQRAREQAERQAILAERNRMALEIHDSLAQAFTGILMQLQAASRFLPANWEQSQSCISRAQDLARVGLVQARHSVGDLCQLEMQDSDLDLFGTLTHTTEQLTAGTSIQAQVCIEGTPYRLNPEVGMNLLRIAQESLTNALRHSTAQKIEICLVYEADRIVVRVRDNGQGFNLSHQARSGFGLKGMQQRCDRIGARLEIITQPGTGTEILVIAPYLSE